MVPHFFLCLIAHVASTVRRADPPPLNAYREASRERKQKMQLAGRGEDGGILSGGHIIFVGLKMESVRSVLRLIGP